MQVNEMVQRLSQLRDLKREVNELSQRIAELEAQASGGGSRISGMPRSQTASDRTARIASALADARDRMEDRRLACMEELGRLYEWIDDLPTSELRQIFSYRYIDGRSWQGVATAIGNWDEQYPRRRHNQYLKTLTKKTNEAC